MTQLSEVKSTLIKKVDGVKKEVNSVENTVYEKMQESIRENDQEIDKKL